MGAHYPLAYWLLRGTYALLTVAVLAGMLRQRRASACYSFQGFLALQLLVAVPGLLDPATWWNWRWVLLTDALEAVALVLVAVELVHKALRAMPPGFRLVSRLCAGVLLVTGVVLVVLLPRLWSNPAFDPDLTRAFIGGCVYGACLLFLAFMTTALYAHVPIDPVQRDIATGLFIWGGVAAISALTMQGYMFVAIGLNMVLAFWAYQAWRPEEPTGLSRRALATFQPWRLARIQWGRSVDQGLPTQGGR